MLQNLRALSCVAVCTALALPAARAQTGTITNYAGAGFDLFCTENFPATSASLAAGGIAADSSGNLYIANFTPQHIVRRVDAVTGLITTVAGHCTADDDGAYGGDGGPATAALMNNPADVAVAANGDLYIAEWMGQRIRKVSAATGIITTVAGTGVFDDSYFGYGDGGPATDARFADATAVAVDASGDIYVVDQQSLRVRKVDATTGIIDTAYVGYTLDEFGDFLTYEQLGGLAVDGPGNIYVMVQDLMLPAPDTAVRRIDAVTGTVTTVTSGFGPFSEHYPPISDVALDGRGHLYVANAYQVWQYDLVAHTLGVLAGTGVQSPICFNCPIGTGDGGPALSATFQELGFLAVGDDEVFINDAYYRVRRVGVPPLPTPDVTVTAAMPQSFLDTLTALSGYLHAVDVSGLSTLLLPNLDFVGLDFLVTGNDDLTTLDAPLLAIVLGNLSVSDNPLLTAIILASLTNVDGDLTISGNLLATIIDLSVLTDVGGSVAITGNPSVATVDLASLVTVGEAISVAGNGAMASIDLASLVSVGQGVIVAGNPAMASIDLASLVTVGEAISVAGNGAMASIDLASLVSVGQGVNVAGNPAMASIDLASLVTVGEAIGVTGNGAMTSLDLASLVSVGQGVNVAGNPAMASVDLASLVSTGGALKLSNNNALTTLHFPVLGTVGGDLEVSANPFLSGILLGSLGSVDGKLTISGNTSATTVDLGALGSTGEGLVITNNDSVTDIHLDALSSTGGGLVITDNSSVTDIHLDALSSTGEGLEITNNDSVTDIHLDALSSTGGGLVITDNSSVTDIHLDALSSTGEGLEITNNDSVTDIHLDALSSTGEGLEITNNDSVTDIHLDALSSTGGGLVITQNSLVTDVSLGALSSTGGDLVITDNPLAGVIDLSALTSVGGNLTLETQGQPTIDLSTAVVEGNLDLTATDATTVSALTAAGASTVSLANDEATVTADLPDGAFAGSVAFVVEHLDPNTLPAVPALDDLGQLIYADPVAAWDFTFGTPTLAVPGTLTFEVDVAGLDAGSQAAFLAAIDAHTVTIAVQGDLPGSALQTLAVCDTGELPSPGGCAQLTLLDATKTPLPPGSLTPPSFVKLEAVIDHFSSYAVVITSESPWTDLRGGLSGSGGIPVLAGSGPLTAGSQASVTLSGAAPSAIAGLFYALSSAPAPFKGGTLVPGPNPGVVIVNTNGAGGVTLGPSSVPPGLTGLSLYLQYAVKDPAALRSIAISNALRGDMQ